MNKDASQADVREAKGILEDLTKTRRQIFGAAHPETIMDQQLLDDLISLLPASRGCGPFDSSKDDPAPAAPPRPVDERRSCADVSDATLIGE